jgi:hypothetical protein
LIGRPAFPDLSRSPVVEANCRPMRTKRDPAPLSF